MNWFFSLFHGTVQPRWGQMEESTRNLAFIIFGHVNRFFRYRFAPTVYLLDLNSAHHGGGQGRKLAKFPHR